MEKKLLLKAEIRKHAGSKYAAMVREKGRIPAVVYGHKKEPIAISLDANNLVEGLHHGHRLMDVQIGKKRQMMIVKDLQYDYLGKDIIHVDLMRVDVTETIKVTVPIELKGRALGTQEGGIIEEHTDHLEIECRVTDIPENIGVDVNELEVGDAVYARDITLPDGVKMETAPETLMVKCALVAAAKSTEELQVEETTKPEVIGEDKDEGEAAEDEDK